MTRLSLPYYVPLRGEAGLMQHRFMRETKIIESFEAVLGQMPGLISGRAARVELGFVHFFSRLQPGRKYHWREQGIVSSEFVIVLKSMFMKLIVCGTEGAIKKQEHQRAGSTQLQN